ncbi:MAG: formylglycine-generating enzyme family protein [Rubrivivax sp.]
MNEMVHIRGGTFSMGSQRFYPEERPVRSVTVDDFWIDAAPVSNGDFARFVRDTGYRTWSEREPVLLPDGPALGSMVFRRPIDMHHTADPSAWWSFVEGACWHRPLGPGSTLDGLEQHPVVHVAYPDALSFAHWAGKSLPTEAQWEFAARGGLEGAEYAWGHTLEPNGAVLANYWQGLFPHENTLQDGWERTSPVGAFPPNGYGLFDMIGNVWEWTCTPWQRPATTSGDGCHAGGCASLGGQVAADADLARVIKGGSHLCAKNYCQRYRPAARHPQAGDSPTGHIGFRCVRLAGAGDAG